jgi:hypothetical protein
MISVAASTGLSARSAVLSHLASSLRSTERAAALKGGELALLCLRKWEEAKVFIPCQLSNASNTRWPIQRLTSADSMLVASCRCVMRGGWLRTLAGASASATARTVMRDAGLREA